MTNITYGDQKVPGAQCQVNTVLFVWAIST